MALLGGIIAAGLGGYQLFSGDEEIVLPTAGPDTSPPLPELDGTSVVLVTMDTTRADHLQPYNPEAVPTPNLQALAQTGTVFEQVMSVSPITLPAHTSILTGLYPPQHGVHTNGLQYVPDEAVSLAELLSDEGYTTAAFVSASVLERRYGIGQGFAHFDDDLSEGRGRHERMVPDRPAEVTIDSALQWLEQQPAEQPFFLWVHLYDPHASYSPPPPYRDIYRDRLYDGEIAYMDAQIGRLLAHPRIADRDATMVMAMGDHGESLGEHGERTHALLAYDSTLHVPWIARVPGGKAGHRVAEPVSQIDFVPTVTAMLGLDTPAAAGGRSLQPQLLGLPAREPPPDLYAETYLPFYTYGWAKLHVLRRGEWKWIDAPAPELYDLSRDPGELSNQYRQQPGLSHDLARDLDEWLAHLDTAGENQVELDSEALDELRGLGYLAFRSSDLEQGDGPRANPMAMIDLHVGLEAARQQIGLGLYEQAKAQLERIFARDPNNMAAMIDLATVHLQLDDYDVAAEVLERALALDAEYPRLYVLLANTELQREAPGRALELLDIALGLDPKYVQATLLKAAVLVEQGERARARAVLSAALEALPREPRLNVAYAQRVELAQGDIQAARARTEAALDHDPYQPRGWLLLGNIAARQGEADQAVEHYRAGLEFHPDDGALHGQLGALLAATGRDGAEQHLREALRLIQTPRPEWLVSLGAVLAEQGRYREADRAYERALAIAPTLPSALSNRAVALYRTGRPEEAAEAWEQLVAAHPRFADAHNNLAAVYLELGELAQAGEHAEAALAVRPGMAEAWNNLGMIRDVQQQRSEAADAYARALAIDPDYWRAALNLARNEIAREAFTAAARRLQGLSERLPRLALVQWELARLFDGPLSEPARAKRHYNAFLKLAPPNSAEAQRARERAQRL